jgi:hypothetical protein
VPPLSFTLSKVRARRMSGRTGANSRVEMSDKVVWNHLTAQETRAFMEALERISS